MIRNRSKGTGKTFVYYFDSCQKMLNFLKIVGDLEHFKGASHMDDLSHLFKMEYLPAPVKGTKEYEASLRMVNLISEVFWM